MKTILLMIVMLAGSGCATTQYQWVDSQSRPEHQHVLNDRACSIYHYGRAGRYLDEPYYYACMKEKGYVLQTVNN